MEMMFYKCSAFEGLGIGAWDTSSVTRMNSMLGSASKKHTPRH